MTDIKRLPSQGLNPDKIASKLFSMHSVAHYYHLQTTVFAQHKMLEELYEALEDHKDAICEYLLGLQAPKRFGVLTQDTYELFNDNNLKKYLDDGFQFSVTLITYAKSNDQEQLANLASDMQGSFNKGRYLNTLT